MSQIQSFSRLSAILTMDNTQFLRGTEVASARLDRFSKKATAFGASISRSLGVGFAFAGAAAVSAAADYNRATATLGAITGKTTEEFKSLNAQSRELGKTTIFTATQIAEAQLEIKKLGFSGERTEKIIKSAADIAAIFGGEITDVGKTIAATLNQFGLDAEQSGDVADIMAVAFRESALDIDKFREAMKNVGPTARATGLDLEQTTAMIGILANNAVDGSLGGTKLRSTLSDLAKKFPDVQAGLDSLNNGTLEYGQLVELLNKRAALVGAIFQDQGDAIGEMEGKLRDANGTTEELAATLEGELFYEVERAKNAFQDLGISIGTAMKPQIQALADSMSDLAQYISELEPEQIQLVVDTLLLVVKAGVISLIAGQVTGLGNAMLTFVNVTIPKFAAGVASAQGAMAAMYGAFLPGAIIAVATYSVDRFFANLQAMGDKVIADYEARIAQKRADGQKIADTWFSEIDMYKGTGRVYAQETVKNFGLNDIENVRERLKEEERDVARLTNNLKNLKKKREEAIEAGESYRDVQRRIVNITTMSLPAAQSREEQFRRVVELYDKNQELIAQKQREAIESQFPQTTVIKPPKFEFDQEAFQRNLDREIADWEYSGGGVFGQRFWFDSLDAADQLAAILNRGGIGNGISKIRRDLDFIEDDLDDFFFEEEDPWIKNMTAAMQKIVDGFDDIRDVAMGFSEIVGQAFLSAANGTETFFESLKNGFLTAFKAIIAKLITLITLYSILAVVSGGTTMAAGGSFMEGLKLFGKTNSFGSFIKDGFTGGRSASFSGSGGNRGLSLNIGGGLMGGDLAFAANSGRSANDRRFG